MSFKSPLILPDLAATDRVGAALGRTLRAGDAVLLEGQLGAGKSALARAAIRARCGAETEVPSPTYTLVQVYEAADLVLWHADLYRLGAPDELRELGFDEAFETAAILIEWPDRLGAWLPARVLRLELDTIAEGAGRTMAVTAIGGGWQPALDAMQAAA